MNVEKGNNMNSWIKIAASPMSREFSKYMQSLGWEQYPGRPSLLTKKFIENETGKPVLFAYNCYRYQISYGDEPLYTVEGGFYDLDENGKPTGYERRGTKKDIFETLYRGEDFKDLDGMKNSVNNLLSKIKQDFKEI